MNTYKAKSGKEYTKKQIAEAVEYWKKQLKKFDESADETVHDDQVEDDTELILDIPGMDPVDIEFEGEWHGVRFAIDLFTDALAHMKSVDPNKYANVSMHVKRK